MSKVPLIQSTTTVKVGNETKTVGLIQPMGQNVESNFVSTLQSYNFNDCPSTLLTSTNQYRGIIQRSSFGVIESLLLEFNITISNSPVQLAPTMFWFNQINFRQSADNQLLGSLYNDSLLAKKIVLHDKSFEASLKSHNLATEKAPDVYLNPTIPLQPGNYKRYLDLSEGGFLSLLNLYWSNANADLIVEMFSNGNPIVSGSGSITLTSLKVICESKSLTAKDELIMQQLNNTSVSSTKFLDVVPVFFSGRSLQTGTNYFDLSSIDGNVAALICAIKPAGNQNLNTGNVNMKYLNAGLDSATLDLVDPNLQSIYGGGTAVSYRFLATLEDDKDGIKTDGFYYKRMIPLNFSDNLHKSLMGHMNGYIHFDSGRKNQLALNLVGTPVSEVQTITLSAAYSAGYYRIGYKNYYSDPIAYNASTSTMAATFAALPTAQRDFVTVVFSGSMSSGTSITATVTNPCGEYGSLIQFQGQEASVSTTAAITTPGVSGIANGTSCDVSIYAWVFREISYYAGKFNVRTVV
jgi:hypothetical protein